MPDRHKMDDIDELIVNIDDGSAPIEPFVQETVPVSRGKNVPSTLLQTDITTGLTSAEVQQRLRTYGENELSEKKEHHFLKFLMYFVGPVQYVMIAAAILSAALAHYIDLGVIISLLLLNAGIGWIQEYKAGSVVTELKKTVSSHAIVIRDGTTIDIPSTQIVPGDIIPLEEGHIIPADGKIINDGFLQVDQSPLTGESLTIEKNCNDVVYSSSMVKRGDAVMIVTCTGDDTFVGETAKLVSGTSQVGHFQKVLTEIATVLLVLVVIFIFIIWVTGIFRSLNIITLLIYTLIITVIGVPVGLPAVVTTTMAVGAAQLARKKVIVQKLAAIESLAGVDILCSDKTGTLTQNKLTMGTPFVTSNSNMHDLLTTAVLASSRRLKGLDPIDRTIILSLKQHPEIKETIKGYTPLEFKPFDPVGKKVLSIDQDVNGNIVKCVKGAPTAVLNFVLSETQIEPMIIEEYNRKVEEFASKGFRSLGIARKSNDDAWQLLGILQLFDPPRYDTAKTIEEAKGLGLEIKMLTGDAVGIAKETSKQLKLGTKVYNIKKLLSSNSEGITMTGSEINDFVEAADGFAEVFPQHKYMVVDILQKRGHLVAMTGDGVNDAPSLKKADTGIAVEGASEAARAAADIVFLNAGLSTIIDALKTSRQIFHRMRAYVIYRIALSIHLEIFLTTMIIAMNTTINPELVVFIAIFADIATLAIAYDNATFSLNPTQWNIPNLWGTAVVLGIFLAIGTWIIYATTLLGANKGIFNSSNSGSELILFLEITLTQSWLIIITRSDGAFWKSLPSWQLISAVLTVDLIATIFTIFGWFSTQQGVDIITIVKIWIFSIGIFTGLALIHQWLNNSKFFNRIINGETYPHKFEDLMYNLERVAMLHEKNGANSSSNGSTGNNGNNGRRNGKEKNFFHN